MKYTKTDRLYRYNNKNYVVYTKDLANTRYIRLNNQYTSVPSLVVKKGMTGGNNKLIDELFEAAQKAKIINFTECASKSWFSYPCKWKSGMRSFLNKYTIGEVVNIYKQSINNQSKSLPKFTLRGNKLIDYTGHNEMWNLLQLIYTDVKKKKLLEHLENKEFTKNEELGTGAEGIVYRVENPFTKGFLAVKVKSMPYQRPYNINKNLTDYYNWSESNQHINLMKVIAFNEKFEIYEYVLPYHKQLQDLEISQKNQIIKQLISVLKFINETGFCHNDLIGQSGLNMLITENDNNLVLKLIDFGAFAKKNEQRPCDGIYNVLSEIYNLDEYQEYNVNMEILKEKMEDDEVYRIVTEYIESKRKQHKQTKNRGVPIIK